MPNSCWVFFFVANIGMWLSLVERVVRDDEVEGSNPFIPTILKLPMPYEEGAIFEI